ncbi:porin [Vibrio sp. SM6]|uniref:Porin n=1 Tax=Vibrio agarilyticus TaxID=2726741 RepID=A0A7X8TNQ5_9VIBR|nr:porin [Vibrio agarilyticus]NLS12111.1 porin [Vibrio agarilyticus]
MKKNILAIAVAAFASQAVAVELYNAQGTTFSLGGHVSVALQDSEKGDLDVGAVSPRINFNATNDLGNGFTADAKGEWSLNLLEGGEESFTTRLGYIGLTHAEFGRAVVGTQWAPYYDAAGVTDMPIAFANDSIYLSAQALGTWRAEKMISYRNGFDFGNAGALNVGFGWQGASEHTFGSGATELTKKFDDRVQLALNYSIADFGLNYAISTGDVAAKTAEAHVFSAAYGSYGSGLYLAAMFEIGENAYYLDTDDKSATPEEVFEDTHAVELLAAYSLANGVNLSVNYEKVSDEKGNSDLLETSALQAEYSFTSQFQGFAGYQFDLADDGDNQWKLGMRYYL